MAKSIEDLYLQYAGRASDPEGLAYWTKDFGETIEPHEISIFQNAVAEARAKGAEPAAQPAFNSAATVTAPLSMQSIADTSGLGATGTGVNAAPAANATREQVLAAYASNPKAELNPSEEAINYWMNTGVGDFNSVVDQVRAENPALAASIDASRAATGNVGALDQATGNVVNTGADVVSGNTAVDNSNTGSTALNNNVIALDDSATVDYNAGDQLDTNTVSSVQNNLGGNYTIDDLVVDAGSDTTAGTNTGAGAVTDTTAKLSGALSQVADTSGLGSTGIGVNVAPVTRATREQVLAAYANNPLADANPTNEAINYWMNVGLGNFNSVVNQVRAENPELAASIDASRAATGNVGALSQAADTGNVASTYKTIYGVEPDAATLAQLTSRFGSTIDANELSSLVVNDTSLRDNPTGVVKTLQQQILDQGTTQYWSGEGFGSAERNAADMARMLASAGITDIKQFGKVTVADDAEVTPVYGTRIAFDPEYGEYEQRYLMGYAGSNGKIVDPSLVTQVVDSEGYGTGVFTAPVGTKQVFGNKETGVPIEANYDRAVGNVFSGTFAGKGSTNYGVQFKEDGTPVFYTQYGGSTNTVKQIMDDFGPLGQIAFAVATGGLSVPQQIAAQAALSLASGVDLRDIAKNLAVNFVMSKIPGSDLIKEGTSYLNSIDSSGILGKAFTSAASSGAKAVLTGQDVGDAILSGAVGGGTSGAIDLMTSSIDGFSDLSRSQQNMVRNAISGVVSGQPLDQVLINTAIEAGKNVVSSAVTENLAQTAFVDAKRTGASDAEAKSASDAVFDMAEANETFDGSGFDSQDAAMEAALADGKDKFTFGGRRFTIDNSAAMIADFTNSVLADEKAATELRAKSDSEWGDLAGAQSDAAARNTVVVGNAEANDVNEAAVLAKIRDPSATSFTFDGKIYTISATQAQMAEANKTATLAEIRDLPKFSDAYARARTLLGPNQTFEWNGKQYSTATAQERSDLSGLSVDALNARNLATVTDASRTVEAQTDTAARDAAAIETARLAAQNQATKSMGNTSFLGQIYKDLNEKFRLQGEAANEYLKNNPNSPITQSVSTAFEAAGELQRNLGGVALALDNKQLADTIINSGSRLQTLGQSLGTGPQDTKNWQDTLSLIDKASGFEKVVVMAGRIMDGTSGLGRQVEVELRQELPALFLGGGSLKGVLIAGGLVDTADTGGAAVIDAYDNVIKNGGTHQEGLSAGRRAGGAAAATEAVIQATLGKIADFGAGKLDNLISKGTAKVVGEGVVEGTQEAGASAAVDLALGNAIDVNKALTQGVVGTAVGKGAATATSGVDAAQTESINNSILTAVASNNTATVNSAITNSVQTSLNSGASVEVAVGNTVGAAITNGADAAASINNVVTTAIDSGADTSQVVASTIISAANAGADTTLAIDSTVTSAITSGADTSQVISSAIIAGAGSSVVTDNVINSTVTAAVTAGADAETVVGSSIVSSLNTGADAATVVNTSVTAAINAGGNASTVVESSVAAAVTAGADVEATVSSSVAAAVTAGADASAVVESSVASVVNSGGDVAVAVDSAVTAAVAAGADAAVVVDSSIAAAINSGSDAAVAVESAVTAAVTAGADVAQTVSSSVAAAVTAGADVNAAAGSSVSAAVTAGADTAATVDSAVSAAITAGADVAVVVDSSVAAAVNSGGNVSTAVDAAVTAAVNAGSNVSVAVDSAVTAAVNAGADVSTAVGSSVAAAINSGADVAAVVESAVAAATTTGASVDAAVASSVASAVNTGADVNTAVSAAVDAAVAAGNNVTVASDANITTITNATTDTQTTVDTATGVTTTVDSANNVTTVVDNNTTTVVDANTNTTSQTTVEGNTQTTVVADAATNTNTQTVVDTKTNTTTSTTVDANNNTTTETTIAGDTQTTVLTDVNTNTQTTVKVNTNTGEVVEVKEAPIPDEWTPPVIEAPVVPPSVTPPTVTATATTAPTATSPLKLPQKLSDEARAGVGGVGMPVGMDLKPASLRSRETQKAIDPLARVKEIQAEFERDAMIQNVDPRLLQILQQRSDPQQQSQQFDNDIGALAKLLSGKPDTPSANDYYSYGAEDSIDDILGGAAANYKEGGFVEPLKASGGSMALPLLAKSGGALGHYKGRENFKEGKHVAGEGDGQSDDIPAWLADGEFVFPADVVSALGNGSTKAGTDKLYEMMHNIRERARSKGPKDLPPPALKSPLDYLKSSKRSTS